MTDLPLVGIPLYLTDNISSLICKGSSKESPLARILRPSLFLVLILASCGPAPSQPPTVLPTPMIFTTSAPTPAILPSETPAIPKPSFEPATYRDETAGFEFDYPASWVADSPQVVGPRGTSAQITSFPRDPGELPEVISPDETIIAVTVLLWDPKNDLNQFVDLRKQGWEDSNSEILLEEAWTLTGDWEAFHFLIKTPEQDVFYLITTVGERYLLLSGTGDLDLLGEVAGTLRQIKDTQE